MTSVLCTILGSVTGFQSMKSLRKSSLSLMSMIMPVKGGSIVALVTPMTVDNAIDYVKLEDLLRWHVAEGNVVEHIYLNFISIQDVFV